MPSEMSQPRRGARTALQTLATGFLAAVMVLASWVVPLRADAAPPLPSVMTSLTGDGVTLTGFTNITSTVTIPLDSGMVPGDTLVVRLPTSGALNLSATTVNGATDFGTFAVDKASGTVTFRLTADLSGVAQPIVFLVNAATANTATTGNVITATATIDGAPTAVSVTPSQFDTARQSDGGYNGQYLITGAGLYGATGAPLDDNYVSGSHAPSLFVPNQALMTNNVVIDPGFYTTAANTGRVITLVPNGPDATIAPTNLWITPAGYDSPRAFVPVGSISQIHVTSNPDGGVSLAIDDGFEISWSILGFAITTPDVDATYGYTTRYTDAVTAVQTNANFTQERFQVVQNGGFIPQLRVTPAAVTIYTTDALGDTDAFLRAGVTATDVQDGTLTGLVQVVSDGGFAQATPGVYTAAFSVRNSRGNTATATKTITVLADQTALTVTDATLRVGDPWTPADTFVSATDADEATVNLAAVTVTDASAVDTTRPGTYAVTYTIKNHGGEDVSETATITVEAVPPVITTDTLPDTSQGASYEQVVTATGTAPVTFAISTGTLPPGLTLDPTTGALTGTTTGSGVFSFTVTATNSGGSDSHAYTIRVDAAVSPTPSPTPDAPTPAVTGGDQSGEPPAGGTEAGDTLPFTGAEGVAQLVGVGAALTAAGTFLTALAGKRRRERRG